METTIDVWYSNTKAGTYVQFKLPVNTYELGELNAYDKYFQKQIREDFSALIKDFLLDFSTESSYLIREGEKNCLVICLQGKTSRALEKELAKLGIIKKEFL